MPFIGGKEILSSRKANEARDFTSPQFCKFVRENRRDSRSLSGNDELYLEIQGSREGSNRENLFFSRGPKISILPIHARTG
ncbi:MAG: hypothetical protein COV67_08960 [Nitrospinae bacterium CG11_big_fil_rev_8_21_14_0_20_56_8]|nr:MAG: hypothetical protein COV67_08960 [Nitrospinae bacterium CG11_big_fil_rev_8_21_14_0_20_56_8]